MFTILPRYIKIYNLKKYFFLFLLTFLGISLQIKSQECGIIYVTPNGASSGVTGTKANPASIQHALTMVAPANNRIYMRAGTYNISQPLNLVNNVVIEGGFNFVWEKSNGTTTTISRTFSNPEPNPLRVVAIYGNNVSNFKLQDLRIQVANVFQSSVSTYGLHLTNCSDYDIVRCRITAGNAGSGQNGTAGINGTMGSPGDNGGEGSETNGTIYIGGLGGTGTYPGSFGGGKGGDSGQRGTYNFPAGGSTFNGNPGTSGLGPLGGIFGTGGIGVCPPVVSIQCDRVAQTDGTNGMAGGAGLAGAPGLNGASAIAGGFYIPGDAFAGGDGTNGSGGGGGGAGGSRGCVAYGFGLPDRNGTGAAGGGGGEGGEGATGGLGGTGGGSSYGIFLNNNGVNGFLRDCIVNSGAAGMGGAGGQGGVGGPGGAGGVRGGMNNCRTGSGGNGGNGGDGGNGGRGGRGADGESFPIFNHGGGNNLTVINFNSLQQPIVRVDFAGCTDSPVEFTTFSTGVSNWFFGAGSVPTSAAGTTALCKYTTLGTKTFTLVNNGVSYTFTDFIHIRSAGVGLDPIVVSTDSIICVNASGSYQSSLPADSYRWIVENPNGVKDTVSGATIQTLNRTFTTVGNHTITLQTFNNCCGYSFKANYFVSVRPNVTPTVTIQSSEDPANTFCIGKAISFSATVTDGGNNPSYQWLKNNNAVGTNSPLFSDNTPANGDEYSLIVVSSASCLTSPNATSNTIVVTVVNQPIITCSVDSFITGRPTFFSADVTSGGLAPFTYNWDFGNYTYATGKDLIRIYDTPGTYTVEVVVTDSVGCSAICIQTINIITVLRADFETNSTLVGCPSLTVDFKNKSVNAITYLWDFGDGTTSTDVDPIHEFINPGVYNVSLSAFGLTGQDTKTVNNQVVVYPIPVANFLAFPQHVTDTNQLVLFADNSYNAILWNWDFGDGNFSNQQSPDHLYTSNGYYDVSLTVENEYGCKDTISRTNYVYLSVGTEENYYSENINVYPNPFKNDINLVITSNKNSSIQIEIFNIEGKIIYSSQQILGIGENLISSKISDKEIPNGIYIMKISTENNVYQQKIIKNN
jgi:PKD repeat protein